MDFIDEGYRTGKKMLEFNQVLARLSTLSQQYSYHSPSAIAYGYPLLLSTPMNRSNLRSMNIGNSSASRSLTNESNNNKRIAEGEPILKQLHAGRQIGISQESGHHRLDIGGNRIQYHPAWLVYIIYLIGKVPILIPIVNNAFFWDGISQ